MAFGTIESLFLLGTALIFFVLIGIRQNALTSSDDDFWFAQRAVTSKSISSTWSASSLSLGLTILYYMAMTSIFGWTIFIISIFTYMLGQIVFLILALKWKRNNPEEIGTISSILSKSTSPDLLIVLAQISGLFGLMAMLYAEIYFGSLIVQSLVGKDLGPVYSTALFIASLTVVAAYVTFGGMRAIVASDRWQMYLVYIAISVLVFLAVLTYMSDHKIDFHNTLPWFDPDIKKVDTASYILFGISANILPLLCQNSLWQMSSSATESDLKRGATGGIIRTFVVFTIVIFVAFVLNGASSGEGGVSADTIINLARAQGPFGEQFLLPLLFVGLIAAMISTADNLLMGSALTVRELLKPMNLLLSEPKLRFVIIFGIALLQIAAYSFFTLLLNKDFQSYFINMVFFLFSQSAPFGVVMLLALVSPRRLRSAPWLVTGVALGWCLDFSAFVYAVSAGIPKVQFFATPLAVLATFLLAFKVKTNDISDV
ncbi:MAG: hypothetical protein ACK5SF_10835 [Hyphomonadaceae bacterium]|jgi:Na+/proline symporter